MKKGFLKTMEAVRPCFYFDRNNLVEGKVSHARKRGSHPDEKPLSWQRRGGRGCQVEKLTLAKSLLSSSLPTGEPIGKVDAMNTF